MKEKFYIPFKDDPSTLGKNLDSCIDQTQFMNFCEEWVTEDSKLSILFKNPFIFFRFMYKLAYLSYFRNLQ